MYKGTHILEPFSNKPSSRTEEKKIEPWKFFEYILNTRKKIIIILKKILFPSILLAIFFLILYIYQNTTICHYDNAVDEYLKLDDIKNLKDSFQTKSLTLKQLLDDSLIEEEVNKANNLKIFSILDKIQDKLKKIGIYGKRISELSQFDFKKGSFDLEFKYLATDSLNQTNEAEKLIVSYENIITSIQINEEKILNLKNMISDIENERIENMDEIKGKNLIEMIKSKSNIIGNLNIQEEEINQVINKLTEDYKNGVELFFNNCDLDDYSYYGIQLIDPEILSENILFDGEANDYVFKKNLAKVKASGNDNLLFNNCFHLERLVREERLILGMMRHCTNEISGINLNISEEKKIIVGEYQKQIYNELLNEQDLHNNKNEISRFLKDIDEKVQSNLCKLAKKNIHEYNLKANTIIELQELKNLVLKEWNELREILLDDDT